MLAEKQHFEAIYFDPNDHTCVISQLSEDAEVLCYNGKWQTTWSTDIPIFPPRFFQFIILILSKEKYKTTNHPMNPVMVWQQQ